MICSYQAGRDQDLLRFNGAGFMEVVPDFNTPVSFTRGQWVYLTNVADHNNAGIQTSCSADYTGDTYLYLSTGELHSIYFPGGVEYDTNYFLPLNAWTHIVWTWEDSGGGTATQKFYVNATLVATDVTSTVFTPCGPQYIGVQNVAGGNDAMWQGFMDDVMLYNVALSQGDVTTLYTNTYRAPAMRSTSYWQDMTVLERLKESIRLVGGTWKVRDSDREKK